MGTKKGKGAYNKMYHQFQPKNFLLYIISRGLILCY
jgi:hypothetical protein